MKTIMQGIDYTRSFSKMRRLLRFRRGLAAWMGMHAAISD